VAGRFPLYTDADVHGPLVEALSRRGWDLVRAVDVFPEGTDDFMHFERAAELGRVMVSNDRDVRRLAVAWLRQGRPFWGLIAWEQEHWSHMTVGDVVAQFEALSVLDDPFAGYPIVYIKPKGPPRRS
jgi:hypothetical protein